jgi:hypothetical protein
MCPVPAATGPRLGQKGPGVTGGRRLYFSFALITDCLWPHPS